jgi:hypothetical protein
MRQFFVSEVGDRVIHRFSDKEGVVLHQGTPDLISTIVEWDGGQVETDSMENLILSIRKKPFSPLVSYDEKFVLRNAKGEFLIEHGPDENEVSADPSCSMWFDHDKSRLEFMLAEYDTRLKGFEIVRLSIKTTVEFTVEKA